jgi:hypothetical protein
MLFGNIELNAQFFTLSIAFLAVLLPLILNILTRKDKQKELKQKSIELFLAIEEQSIEQKKQDDFGYIYAKNDCLSTMTGYKANDGFFDELNKFKQPIMALETYRKYHLRIKNFPEKPKLSNRFSTFFIFIAFILLSIGMLPFISQMTIDNYKLLNKHFSVNSKDKKIATSESNIRITSETEWVIDTKNSTLNLASKPKLILGDKTLNKKEPLIDDVQNTNKSKTNDTLSPEQAVVNKTNFLADGKDFLFVVMLFLTMIMSFLAQMFLFILVFGSLIKAVDYLTEPSKNLENSLKLKEKYCIGPIKPEESWLKSFMSAFDNVKLLQGCKVVWNAFYNLYLYLYVSGASAINGYLRK